MRLGLAATDAPRLRILSPSLPRLV